LNHVLFNSTEFPEGKRLAHTTRQSVSGVPQLELGLE